MTALPLLMEPPPMELAASYPTPEHQQAAEVLVEHFRQQPDYEAVLLVNSCARGRASRDSCLDVAVLVPPDLMQTRGLQSLEAEWERFYQSHSIFQTLHAVGKYSVVHLDFFDGQFAPQERNEAAGPDFFEVEVGNRMRYVVPLWQGSERLAQLQAQWLPYYDDALRRERLAMVHHYCLNNLHHIPLYVARGLHFQAFDRLYNAFQEFLQILFIAHRTYPIAYNKWIREQIVEILGLPDLYARLPALLEICPFESDLTAQKAKELEALVEHYVALP